jgi:hypothetical protein
MNFYNPVLDLRIRARLDYSHSGFDYLLVFLLGLLKQILSVVLSVDAQWIFPSHFNLRKLVTSLGTDKVSCKIC